MAGTLGVAGCLGGNQDTKQEILDTYGEGIELYNESDELINNGRDDFENENWESAGQSWESAEDKLSDARDKFSRCVELTYEVDEADAREICSDAETQTDLLIDAVDNLVRAADESAAGNYDQAEQYANSADETATQAREYQVRDASTLQSTLEN